MRTRSTPATMHTRDGLDLRHRHHRIQRALDRQLAGASDRRRHPAHRLHRRPPPRPATVRIGSRRRADRKLAGADRRRRGADARDHASGLARRARRATSCEPASTSFATRTASPTPAASRCGPRCWHCWSNTGARRRRPTVSQQSPDEKPRRDTWPNGMPRSKRNFSAQFRAQIAAAQRPVRNHGGEIIPKCRGRGSYGCWGRPASQPTNLRSNCFTRIGAQRAGRSSSPAGWRKP